MTEACLALGTDEAHPAAGWRFVHVHLANFEIGGAASKAFMQALAPLHLRAAFLPDLGNLLALGSNDLGAGLGLGRQVAAQVGPCQSHAVGARYALQQKASDSSKAQEAFCLNH